MTAIIDQALLLAAVTRVRRAVLSKNTIPILSHMRIEARGGTVTLIASDLDVESRARVEAQVEAPFDTCVPADVLSDFAKRAPKGAQIKLSHDAEKHRMRLSFGRSSVNVATLPAEDFPLFDAIDDGADIAVKTADLKAIAEFCGGAISTEEAQYYLNGIFLHIHEGRLRGVATNARILARIDSITPPEDCDMPAVIIPTRAVGMIAVLPDEDVTMTVSERRIHIEGGDWSLSAKTIDGTFPDYHRVIPPANSLTTSTTAAGGALSTAIATAIIGIAKTDSHAIAFEADENTNMIALSRRNDTSDAAVELTAQCDGGGRIGFSHSYATVAINALGEGPLSIKFGEIGAPTLWGRPDDSDAIFVIMPMRV